MRVNNPAPMICVNDCGTLVSREGEQNLSKLDRRACEILLVAARQRATVSDFRAELHRERIYSRTWSPLFEALGLVCVPVVPGSEERCLTFEADNVVAFVPRASVQPAPQYKGMMA